MPEHSEDYKGYLIEIHRDCDPEDPRTWDNLGTMECFHGRYRLGDNKGHSAEEFSGWNEFEEHLVEKHEAAAILPLFLYDHSGITMNTTGFSCPWDSGQVGFIYASRDDVLHEYGAKRISKSIIDRATKILEGEVALYDQYLRGDVYGYKIMSPLLKGGEERGGSEGRKELESCWGFYGLDCCIRAAKQEVDALTKEAK